MKNLSPENYNKLSEILAEAHSNVKRLREETRNRRGEESTIEIEFWKYVVIFSLPRLTLKVQRKVLCRLRNEVELPHNVDQLGLKTYGRLVYLDAKDVIWLVKNWPTICYRLNKRLCKIDAKLARTLVS